MKSEHKAAKTSDSRNLFIVIEGADGSGKATQLNLLADKLRKSGYEVEVFDFPRYEEGSSHFVRAYLNGEYGPAGSVNPYTASLFYALDRYEASPRIRSALKAGKIVVSNRYVGSNMAHQGSKFDDESQQRGFFLWEDGLEYQLLGIPRPSINLYLRVPADISFKLIYQKAQRSYTSRTHDEHEADISHLEKSVKTYDTLTQLFPKDFVAIDCVKNDELLSVNDISKLVWEKIRPLLPPQPGDKKPGIGPDTTFMNRPPEAVRQTTPSKDGITIKLKKVSLLASAALQDVFANLRKEVDFSQGFDYYLPENISDETATLYTDSMEKMKKNHLNMGKALSASIKNISAEPEAVTDGLLHLTPLAAYCSVSIRADDKELRQAIALLAINPLHEVRQLAAKIETIAANKGMRVEGFVSAKNQGGPEALSTTIAKFAQDRLPQPFSARDDDLELLHTAPRNEFELIAGSSIRHMNVPPGEALTEIDGWSYERKKEALDRLLKKVSNETLTKVVYRFSATYDRVAIDKLVRDNYISELSFELPAPKRGYDVPEIVEETGREDLLADSFDESLVLFSHLQASGREEYGAYATLMGHKVRCQFTIQADRLFNASTGSKLIVNILSELRDKIREAHPLLANHMDVQLKTTTAPRRSGNRDRRSSKRSSKS